MYVCVRAALLSIFLQLHRTIHIFNGHSFQLLHRENTTQLPIVLQDLMDNRPDAGDVWGLHSWSDQGAGNWTACRFPDMSTQSNQNIAPSEATLECSWRKPSELTHYPGSGYENALWSGDPDVTVTPETALKGWQESVKHHELMTNGGSWVDNSFKAVGAGFLGEYAVMWVGEEVDPS